VVELLFYGLIPWIIKFIVHVKVFLFILYIFLDVVKYRPESSP
jgi:hypothetical protein